jgi:hypothetical protein
MYGETTQERVSDMKQVRRFIDALSSKSRRIRVLQRADRNRRSLCSWHEVRKQDEVWRVCLPYLTEWRILIRIDSWIFTSTPAYVFMAWSLST